MEAITAGETVLYIDFEDGADNVIPHLLALGATPTQVLEQFIYIRPEESFDEEAADIVDRLLVHRAPALVVLDGVTEAMTLENLSIIDNADVARWLKLLPRRCALAGAAVVLVDHVVKDAEARGKYAIGAQHKRAGIDVAYAFRVLEPFAPGRSGKVRMTVAKDRPGAVRAAALRIQKMDVAADVHIHSEGADKVRLEVVVADLQTNTEFRPTHLMEKVSRHDELHPGAIKTDLRALGHHDYVDVAITCLVDGRYMRIDKPGRSHEHHVIRPYREGDEE